MHFDFEQRFYFAEWNGISITHLFKVNTLIPDFPTYDFAVVFYYNKVSKAHVQSLCIHVGTPVTFSPSESKLAAKGPPPQPGS